MKTVLMLGRHRGTFVREHLSAMATGVVSKHFIDYPSVHKKLGHHDFQTWLVRLCAKFEVKTLIVDAINGFYHFDQKTFTNLRSLNVALLGTCFDNSTEHRFYLNCYQQFDGVIVTSSRTRFIFDAYGIPSRLYWPQTIECRQRVVPWDAERVVDCSFVGSMKSNRKQVLERISSAEIDLSVFGSDTPSGRVTKDQYWEILGDSKITLNFNRQNHHQDWLALDPLSNWCSIPTLRNLEAGIAGTLCLAEWVPEYEDLFPGFDDLTFVTVEEAVNKITFFLRNPEIRLQRARDYQNRCLELHADRGEFGSLVDDLSSAESRHYSNRSQVARKEIYEEPMYRINKCIFFFRIARYFLSKGKGRYALESLWRFFVMVPSVHIYWFVLPCLRVASFIELLVRKRRF